jgi:hypothetical protein
MLRRYLVGLRFGLLLDLLVLVLVIRKLELRLARSALV